MNKLTALFALAISMPVFAGIDMQSVTSFTATTTSAEAVDSDVRRNYLLVQNRGSVSVYMKFDSAHTGVEGVTIAAGGNYIASCAAPTDAVYIKADSSTALVTVYEGIGDCP